MLSKRSSFSKFNQENAGTKYFEVDSSFRNRQFYPNPFDFAIPTYIDQFTPASTFNDPVLLSQAYTGGTGVVGNLQITAVTDSTHFTLDPTEVNITNYYINNYLEVAQQFQKITFYSGSTHQVTIAAPFTVLPTVGEAYSTRKMPNVFQSNVLVPFVNASTNTVSSLLY